MSRAAQKYQVLLHHCVAYLDQNLKHGQAITILYIQTQIHRSTFSKIEHKLDSSQCVDEKRFSNGEMQKERFQMEKHQMERTNKGLRC